MTELLPGWPLSVEESTANHWVGACREIVMVFAYEGSHDDVQHVIAAGRLIERVNVERGTPAKLLFALPPRHSKPPSSRVRSAIVQSAGRLKSQVSRFAVVVSGSGFGAAVHRSAFTGLLTLIRPNVPFKVEARLSDAIDYLLGADRAALDPLVRFCEQRLIGG